MRISRQAEKEYPLVALLPDRGGLDLVIYPVYGTDFLTLHKFIFSGNLLHLGVVRRLGLAPCRQNGQQGEAQKQA